MIICKPTALQLFQELKHTNVTPVDVQNASEIYIYIYLISVILYYQSKGKMLNLRAYLSQ